MTLPDRIVGALRLCRMTISELARSLSTSKSAIRRYVEALQDEGIVVAHRDPRIHRSGRPAKVFEVAA